MKNAYIYLIRCQDDSLYTGIAVDLEKRLLQHYKREKECAKYTKAHPMKCLEMAFEVENLSIAAKYEYRIKRLGKMQKQHIISHPEDIQSYMPAFFLDYTVKALDLCTVAMLNQKICNERGISFWEKTEMNRK